MDVHDLEAFLAVVEHGGFRAAADSMFMSQPSLSRKVKNLERDLKVRLLDRGPWGLRLTGHGEMLVSGARRILSTIADVRTATVGAWDETIRLGAAATAAGSYLATFLSRWIPEHPECRITMIEDGALRLQRRLAEQECDIAILAAPVPSGFDHLPITQVGVYAVLPPDHPLAAEVAPLSVESLQGQRVLVNGNQFLSTTLFSSACRASGVQPEVVYECTVGQTLAALAEAGLGIAILSDNVDLRGFDLPTRRLRGGEGLPLAFDLHVAWSRDRVLPPSLYEFAEDLSRFTQPLRDRSLASGSRRSDGNRSR